MKKLKILAIFVMAFFLSGCSYRCYSIMDQCERAAGRKPESIVVSDNTSTIPGRDPYFQRMHNEAQQRYVITKLKNR